MPMKTSVFLTLLLTLAIPLAAAAADAPPAGLADWGKQLVEHCPDESFEVAAASVPTPAGFTAWTLSQKSSWAPCAQRLTLFASANQVIAGRAFPLPADSRPLVERIAERARPLLDKDVSVVLEKETFPDGIRAVRMSYASPEGPIPLGAFIDRSAAYLVIGVRGTLGTDPAAALVDTLSKGAMTRGAKDAKVVVLEVSDFQCPGCATLHAGLEPFILEHLDEIEYRRIDMALFEQHDWTLTAAAAGKAIQRFAPAVYWEYVDHIFRQQPDLTAARIETVIRDFAEGHELDWKKIEREMRSPAVRRGLVAQMGTLFSHGIFATPTVLVNGRIVSSEGGGVSVIEHIKVLLKK